MVHKITGWIFGFLNVYMEYGESRRFINLCRNNGIEIWNIRADREKGIIWFCIRLSDFWKLHHIAKKCHVFPRVYRRIGFPFLLTAAKKNINMVMGIAIFFIMLIVFSSRIWGIEISGQSYYTEENIVDYLDTKNIYCGMYGGNIDHEKIEKQIRKHYDGIGWVSVNKKGSRLLVNVREMTKDKIITKKKPADLVASDDGKVISIVTSAGTAKVRKGKKVKKGKVLISGIVPVNTTFADAATVCWYDITGMQAFDHALEMEMMDSQMLTQFLVSLCGTLERLESFLLDPRHLWFSRESIFKNNRDGSFWFCYCPEGKENITEGFQKLMEYLLTKIDHKDQRAVKMAYHIYDQVIKEGYSLIAIRESLTYDRVDIEPVPDRTLENSRVELEQTSDQTEKEKNVHKADKADGKAKVIFQKAIEHFFPDLAKIKEYRQELAKKKEKKNEIQPIVFEPEEEEVRMGRPTVLLADQKKTIQGILRYEGNNQLSDLKIDTFPYVIGSAADCPGYVDCATISRHHAKITKVENVYFIEDMNSANGTKAGGTLLDYKMKVSLQANEILEFADEKFRFI